MAVATRGVYAAKRMDTFMQARAVRPEDATNWLKLFTAEVATLTGGPARGSEVDLDV